MYVFFACLLLLLMYFVYDIIINTVSTIPLKLLSCTSMTISIMQLSLSSWLFVAFNTIYHNILMTHLSSWFGIHGTVLNWFKSYLSSHSFHVNAVTAFLPPTPAHVAFLKVLSSVLYSPLCTPSLSIPLSRLCHLTITFMQMTQLYFFLSSWSSF